MLFSNVIFLSRTTFAYPRSECILFLPPGTQNTPVRPSPIILSHCNVHGSRKYDLPSLQLIVCITFTFFRNKLHTRPPYHACTSLDNVDARFLKCHRRAILFPLLQQYTTLIYSLPTIHSFSLVSTIVIQFLAL